MKKRLTIVLALVAACHGGGGTASPSPKEGAASPQAAVTAFLTAGKAQDLQALGAVWGTSKGPSRNGLTGDERANYERRELIIVHLLCQEQVRILGESQGPPGMAGSRTVDAELAHGTTKVSLKFTTVRGPGDRWFVSDVPELDKLQGMCR